MTHHGDPDLGAVLQQILAAIVEREQPILAAHGLSMWEYVILSQLHDHEAVSQRELAARSRRDPTRLIANLEAMSDRGLVARPVDGADRRRRAVVLTDDGSRALRSAQADIRRMEEDLLAVLAPGERAGFRGALAAVARSLGDVYSPAQEGPEARG